MIDLLRVVQFAAPVALAAVGESVNQKAGTINIGLEGTMLTGAFFAFWVASVTYSPWIGVGAAVFSAVLLAAIAGFFIIKLATDQVVVGTAINLLALGLTGTLYRSAFGTSGQLLSVGRLPAIGGVDPLMILLILAAPLLAWVIARTNWGLALRAAGEMPKAVEAAGFSVSALRLQALLIGGVFAGLAGGYLSLVINGSFTENCTVGRGFVAIAMVTFGKWRPIWVLGAAVLIGFMESLQYSLQSAAIPFQFWVAMPYVAALIVLAISKQNSASPKALGVPYRREK